ncbi:MAG: Spy/CpxP family protein refolding chaperone [Desulfobacteraceae bacterium]|nr:Spy/CpxP family protein refolding chaperone [Desulfobacteraceae bacterium]
MKKSLAALLLGSIFTIFAPCYSYAQMQGRAYPAEGMMHQRMGMFRAGRPPIWRAFKGLGLNEQQKKSIREAGDELLKESIRKRADIQIARIELKELLQNDNVDMAAVKAKLKQIASLQTDIRLSRIKAIEQAKAEMTPKQRMKFKENLEAFRRMAWRPIGGEHMKHFGYMHSCI